jgi:hypothetical protein
MALVIILHFLIFCSLNVEGSDSYLERQTTGNRIYWVMPAAQQRAIAAQSTTRKSLQTKFSRKKFDGHCDRKNGIG